MKNTLIVISMFLLTCCSAKLIMPTQTDVDRVDSRYPGYTLAELSEGKTLYEQNCGSCHPLKKLSSEPESEWKEIVPEMIGKVNKKAKMQKLNAEQEQKILRYVLTMRDAPGQK